MQFKPFVYPTVITRVIVLLVVMKFVYPQKREKSWKEKNNMISNQHICAVFPNSCVSWDMNYPSTS